MNKLNIFRHGDWWLYKLPPILLIAYAVSVKEGLLLYQMVAWLAYVLLNLCVGAIYASLVNDATDVDDDLRAGKPNRMASWPPWRRFAQPALVLICGLCLLYPMWPDYLSVSIGLATYLTFTLYSVSPVRLKDKGAWGLAAMAFGESMLPSVFMVFFFSARFHLQLDWHWACSVALWSFCFGVRGILWHQYKDREHDIRSGTKTFAHRVAPQQFKPYEWPLLCLELIALAAVLGEIGNLLPFLFLVMYLLWARLKYVFYKCVPIIVFSKQGSGDFQIVLFDYYQVFFPLSLLVYIAYTQPYGWCVLLMHVFLFYRSLWFVFRDVLHYVKYLLG